MSEIITIKRFADVLTETYCNMGTAMPYLVGRRKLVDVEGDYDICVGVDSLQAGREAAQALVDDIRHWGGFVQDVTHMGWGRSLGYHFPKVKGPVLTHGGSVTKFGVLFLPRGLAEGIQWQYERASIATSYQVRSWHLVTGGIEKEKGYEMLGINFIEGCIDLFGTDDGWEWVDSDD